MHLTVPALPPPPHNPVLFIPFLVLMSFLSFDWQRSLVSFAVILVLLAGSLIGCESQAPSTSYVARVGDHHLTHDELDRLLEGMGPTPDTSEARQQIIEQWVTQTLLYREALRMNLEQVDEVQHQLDEHRRSTLVSAMTDRIYEEAEIAPSEEEIQTYFERHREQLRLREPYVNVRYLSASTVEDAQTIRNELITRSSLPDSTWRQLIQEYAMDPAVARQISAHFMSEGRLFAQLPFLRDELDALQEGQVAPIVQENERYHVVQLVRQISEGTEPEVEWVEEEIRRRLRIRARKQMYAREVQRLRNEARANDELELP